MSATPSGLLRCAMVGLASLAAISLAPSVAMAQTPLKLTFAMPTTASPYLLPFIVAQDLGWYEKAGLKVEEKVVTGDVNCLRAVISRDADITDIGPNTIMQGFSAGGKIQIIGGWQPVVDYQVVVRSGIEPDIKTLNDKKWAISSAGGMLQHLPRMMMEKDGVDASKIQYLAVGGYAARYQALAAGTVDATLLDVFTTMRGEAAGKIKKVAAVTDAFPGLAFVYIVARQGALADTSERKALQILMTEAIRGARYIVDHPHEAAEIMEKRLKDTDVDGMAKVLAELSRENVWGLNGGLDRQQYEFSEKTYRAAGEVKEEIPYEKLVDGSLVDEALRTLGRR